VANVRDFSGANALAEPVEETVGTGVPVRQGEGLRGPYFDFPGTRWTYVQWCAPPLAPRPNRYFNWSVLVPPQVSGKAPVELYFHPAGYSYAQPSKKLLLGSIQIAPHDYPPSGWYGFNEAWGTGEERAWGRVINHTQKRVLDFLEWAKKELPIDPDRVFAVGGDGAAAIALAYPDVFAGVYITGFEARVLNPKMEEEFAAAWGPRSAEIRDAAGRGQWGWAMLDELVSADPGRDLPLFVCRGASWGRDEGWGKGRGRFYRAMLAGPGTAGQAGRAGCPQPLVGHWAWGGELPCPNKYDGLWRGLDLTRTSPVLAFSNSSLDQEGEGNGQTNLAYAWRDLKDAPEAFEVTVTGRESTFDLTPRRTQQFRMKPGELVRWEAVSLPVRKGESPAVQRGETAADAHGRVTVRGLQYPRDAGGLVVRLARVP
jgi:hypothetical protein